MVVPLICLLALLGAAAPSSLLADDTDRAAPPPAPPIDPRPYRELLAARQALDSGDSERAGQLLEATTTRHPLLLAPALARARFDLRHAPRRVLDDLHRVARIVRLSFPVQALWLSRASWWCAGSLLLLLSLLAAARALTLLPPLHHLLFERLAPTRDERLARVGAAVLLVLPFIWGLGLLGSSLILVALGSRTPRRGDRSLIAAGTLAILLVGSAGLWVPAWIAPPDYRDAALVLATATDGRLTPEIEARLVAGDESRPTAAVVRGLALRRSGRLHEARAVLEDAVARLPREPVALIALGNCLLEAGEPLAAAKIYERALAVDGENVVATYNQALAVAGLMRFEESERLLARAAQLDFAAVREARAAHDATTVATLEPIAPPAWFWRLYLAGGNQPGMRAPLPLRRLLPWQGGVLWPLILPAIGLALLFRRTLWRRLATFECSVCGQTVCRRCVRRSRSRILCRNCAAEIGEISSAELVSVLAAGRRRRRARWVGGHELLFAWLAPGYGLLRLYRPGLAMTVLAILAGGLMGLVLPANLPPLPPAPEVFAFPLGRLVPLGALVLGYLLAVGLGFKLQERDLNHGVHGHLLPLAGPAPTDHWRTGTGG